MFLTIFILFLLILISVFLYFSKKDKDLKEKLSIFEKTFQDIDSAMVIIDNQLNILYSNNMAKTMFVSDEEIMRKSIFRLDSRDATDLEKLIKKHKSHIGKAQFAKINAKLSANDDAVFIKIYFKSFISEKKEESLITFVKIDIVNRENRENREKNNSKEPSITELNNQDFLLHLPNQNQALIDIHKSILDNKKFALLLFNIDNFLKLKSILGQSETDILLEKIVIYLKNSILQIDGTLYSALSDTFLIKIPDIDQEEDLRGFSKRIKHDIKDIINSESMPIDISFSIGGSFFPFYGNGSTMLMKNTYKALVKSKEGGKGIIYIDKHIPDYHNESDKLKLYNEMKIAIDKEQFELYYQPLFDTKTGIIAEADALVRWQHPTRGLISPMEFIPFAQKTGLIVSLNKLIISHTIKQQKKWEIYNFPPIKISINITLRELQTEDFVDFVDSELLRNQISSELVKLKISENIAMTNATMARKQFISLSRLGVSLGLGNFGKGHSSFEHLKALSIRSIQIDRMFILDLVSNIDHQKIVKAIIALGHNFDLDVIAVGIEDKETYDLLKSYNCDFVQGYYFSIPLPTADFQHMLREKTDISSAVSINKEDNNEEERDFFDQYTNGEI